MSCWLCASSPHVKPRTGRRDRANSTIATHRAAGTRTRSTQRRALRQPAPQSAEQSDECRLQEDQHDETQEPDDR